MTFLKHFVRDIFWQIPVLPSVVASEWQTWTKKNIKELVVKNLSRLQTQCFFILCHAKCFHWLLHKHMEMNGLVGCEAQFTSMTHLQWAQCHEPCHHPSWYLYTLTSLTAVTKHRKVLQRSTHNRSKKWTGTSQFPGDLWEKLGHTVCGTLGWDHDWRKLSMSSKKIHWPVWK